MELNWNDLQVFLALERGGTARSAAQRLKCSHSTVLRRLEAFEDTIGAPLFDRTAEGFILTSAGARILARAQQIEAEMLELSRSIAGADIRLQGQIRLTIPPPVIEYLVLPMLDRFRRTHPDIDIEVISTYAYSNLLRRDADVAVRFSEKPDDHLLGRRLPVFFDGIYATPDYVKAHWSKGVRKNPRWICWPETRRFRERVAVTEYADTPTGWTLPTLALQTRAALNGMGMAFLPCFMGDTEPGLVRVPDSGAYPGRPGWIMTHPDLRRLERVRVFARYLGQELMACEDLITGQLPR